MAGIKEECGVFGIYDLDGGNVVPSIYYGLTSLQHRGQESCGLAVSDTKGERGNVKFHKDLGLVSEVLRQDVVRKYEGDIGIGHVRYSTTGASVAENAQPLVLSYVKGTLALAHNGNLVNTPELKWELIQNGAIFHTTTDSEVIAFHIARERVHSKTVEEAVLKTARKIKGAYGLVVMSPRKLIAVRDPYGLKPLCLGKRGNTYVVASESCALTSVSAEFVRDIEPGEILTITKDGLKSNMELATLATAKRAHCVFEYIYFARLDSTIDGVKVYDARIRGGKSLAKSYPVDADIVTGVPESGLPAAKGYSEASGIPFAFAFYKNSYIGRTFIKPTQEERESSVHLKLSVLESVVKGKRIVLVDDSIVRGTTIANLIHMLKEAGASKNLLKIIIKEGNRKVDVTALVDTGNNLFEPMTGKPVSIIEKTVAEKIINENKPVQDTSEIAKLEEIKVNAKNDSNNIVSENKEHDNKEVVNFDSKKSDKELIYEFKKEIYEIELKALIPMRECIPYTKNIVENIKKLDKVKQDLEYASDMCTEVISIYTTMDIPQLSNDEYTKMLIDARNDVKTAYELREKAMESAITLINTKNPKYIGKITEYLNLSDNYIANFKDRLTDLNQIIDEQ